MDIPVRGFKLSKNIPYKLPEIIDITDKLPQKEKLLHRELSEITGLSVHHSAVEGATIESYANYHVNNRGWHCIGYTFVIKGRQIYQTNTLDTLSYHTHDANTHNIGVCVSGDLSKRHITADEQEALYGLLLSLIEALPEISNENVKGHREFPHNMTTCPGTLDLVELRKNINILNISMKRKNTENAKIDRAIDVMKEVTYLYHLASSKELGKSNWALTQLDGIHAYMESKQLVK